LYISKDTPVFYEEPDKICEETLLGLYVYGLPDGVKASVRWNSEDQPEIELIGNSSESRENETQIKICFVHVSNDTNVKGKIGDYDLNDTIMCVSYCSIEGFTIGSDVGDDRSCYKIEEINLSQNGEVTDEIPDASGFTAEVRFNKTKERTASDTLCLAVYDTDGRFMYIDSLKARFAKDFDYSFGFDVPEQESSIGAIKAFVWSGYDSLTPLGNSKELIN
jgi:hypothetical protein